MMPCKMTLLTLIGICAALCLCSCSTAVETVGINDISTATPSVVILKTTLGEFIIARTRLVDEVHEQQARPEEKFLLVTLTKTDATNLVPGEFMLEDFQKMIQDNSGQIYVTGKDGSQYSSNMAGWEQDEFVMGFSVPEMQAYTLYWPGNPPIELTPTNP